MLHQIALFENLAINNVVVLSEVLEDVISRNIAVYYRIKALCTNATKNFFIFYNEHHRDAYVEEKVGTSPNDRTDKAIRVSAHLYQSHLAGSIQILLITNNRESKKNTAEEGLSSETVESYVRPLQQPNLLDLVAIPTSLDILKGELDDLRLSKREVIYPEHKHASEITSSLLHGIYHKRRFRVNRYNPLVGYVGDEIVICNRVNINKAFGGDIVAAELLCPQYQRTEEKSLIVGDVNGNVDDAPRNANIGKVCAGSSPTVSSFSLARPCLWYYKEKLEFDTQIQLYYSNSGWTQKTHDLLDIEIYPNREANQMIEEFMLACNFSVAKIILKLFSTVFLVVVCHVSFVWNLIVSINRVILRPLALIPSIELTGDPPPTWVLVFCT